jgi:hypothetical protein
MTWINRLKQRWRIDSDRDFWMIMLTFSLAGMTIMVVRRFLFPLVGITNATPMWVKVTAYLPLAFIAYQIGLLLWGSLLGQFNFFWAWEKRMLRFLLGRSKHIQH